MGFGEHYLVMANFLWKSIRICLSYIYLFLLQAGSGVIFSEACHFYIKTIQQKPILAYMTEALVSFL